MAGVPAQRPLFLWLVIGAAAILVALPALLFAVAGEVPGWWLLVYAVFVAALVAAGVTVVSRRERRVGGAGRLP